MQKQAPTRGRLATMVIFALSCFALLLFLWLSFGGSIPLKPKGYQFNVGFPQAASLAAQSDVRIAGINVGKVVSISTASTHPNVEVATIELSPQYAPLHVDARAILRQKTLLGETYVQLTPGTPGAAPVPDGGWLAASHVQPNVYFDQVLQAFDPTTRQAFRNWQQDIAVAGTGRGLDLNDAFGNLPQFTDDLTRALKVLNDQSRSVSLLIRNTGVAFGALNRNTVQLRNLVVNAGSVFQATSNERRALAQTIHQFPTFEDESKSTLGVSRQFALNTHPLINTLIPVARALAPTLSDVRRLSPDLRRLFINTDPLVTASQTGLPALRDLLNQTVPLLGALDPFLEQLNPALQFIELYQLQTSEFLGHAPQTQASTTQVPAPQLGHYLRGFSVNGPDSLTVYSQRPPSNRGNSYVGPNSRQGQFLAPPYYVWPQFDCSNTGRGQLPASPGGPLGGGIVGCHVDPAYAFQGTTTKFPHVHPDNYGP